MNSKLQMASISLVGAIPGLVLSIVLVVSLVSYFQNMSFMIGSLAALTLLASVGLSMLPVVIMVFGPKTVEDESKADEEQSGDSAAAEEENDEFVADEEEQKFDLDEDAADEPDVLSDEDFDDPGGDADDVFVEGDEEEFDMGLFEDEK